MVMVKVMTHCDNGSNGDYDYFDDDYGMNEDSETLFCF